MSHMNLVKLCVGIATVEELEAWREAHFADGTPYGMGLHVHRTRMMPTRRGEIVGKGSLYWVIGGHIRCRQAIVSLEAATDHEGRSCCDIVMDDRIIRTIPQPKRPFQGWRYLRPQDAPADLSTANAGNDDGALAAELARLGLI